ncbi:MAG: peptidoglycan-binding protein [Pyrinomonadaceae bacterium]
MPLNYQVKQGDCISSIAFEHGFHPDTVWNFPANAELKKIRRDPNVLQPGDIVVIPDIRPKEVGGATNQVHKFYRKAVPEKLRLQFKLNNQPRANEPFELEVDGEIVLTGRKTDSQGRIQCPIPPNAREVRVFFNGGREAYKFYAGFLNPIDEISGIQARLKNLGYYSGPVDNKPSSSFEDAVRSFQRANNLRETGETDDQTKAAIKGAYGG